MSIKYHDVNVGVTLGEGGGGGENAFIGFDTPDASLGSDGQYFFKLLKIVPAIKNSLTSNASYVGGWEFTALGAFKVVGMRCYVRSATTAALEFGTTSEVLRQVTGVSLASGVWTEVMFDTPVTLTAGTNYVVRYDGPGSKLTWSSSHQYNTDKIQYVQGRYGAGSWPGSAESGSTYSVDILIELDPPFKVDAEYYKSSGAWSAVT